MLPNMLAGPGLNRRKSSERQDRPMTQSTPPKPVTQIEILWAVYLALCAYGLTSVIAAYLWEQIKIMWALTHQ
jgi:hypothetical protein